MHEQNRKWKFQNKNLQNYLWMITFLSKLAFFNYKMFKLQLIGSNFQHSTLKEQNKIALM